MQKVRAKDLGNTQGFKFEKRGDKIVGYYVKTTDETINGNPAKKHYFDTSKGIVTVLGQANMYKQLVDNNCLNLKVEIEFTGQTLKLRGGKTMKVYTVDYYPEDTYTGAGSIEAETLGEIDHDYSEADDLDPPLESDDTALDEVPVARAARPTRPAATPTSESAAAVRNVLRSRAARS